jgi:hypothetical protein
MSHYLFQFFALLLAAILFAIWQRQTRARTAPVRDGFYLVRWPLILRLINGVLLIIFLAMSAYLIWARVATDENVPFAMWVLVIVVLGLSRFGTLFLRTRTEYNNTAIIAFSTTGKPSRFALSDFTRAGPITWRGHEFSTETGERIYVNSYQTGGPALIDVLQRQAKETDFE